MADVSSVKKTIPAKLIQGNEQGLKSVKNGASEVATQTISPPSAPVNPEAEARRQYSMGIYTRIDPQSGLELPPDSFVSEVADHKATTRFNKTIKVGATTVYNAVKGTLEQPIALGANKNKALKRSVKLEKGKEAAFNKLGLPSEKYQYKSGKLTVWGEISGLDLIKLSKIFSSDSDKNSLDKICAKSQKPKLSFMEKIKNLWGEAMEAMDLDTKSGWRRSAVSFLTGLAFAPIAIWDFVASGSEYVAKKCGKLVNVWSPRDLLNGLLALVSKDLFGKEESQTKLAVNATASAQKVQEK